MTLIRRPLAALVLPLLALAACTQPAPPKAPLQPAPPVAESATSDGGSGTAAEEPKVETATPAAPAAPAPERPGPSEEFVAEAARLERERQERERAAAEAQNPPREAVPARNLVGSRWWPVGEGAEFREMVFLDTLMVAVDTDGVYRAWPADYSGNHPMCSGYPTCVFVADPNASPRVYLFGRQSEYLFPVECVSALGLEAEQWQQIRTTLQQERGGLIVHDDGPSVCWNATGVPYRSVPLWWTERDEAQMRAAQAEAEAEQQRNPPAPGELLVTP